MSSASEDTRVLVATSDEAGLRLDVFLARRFGRGRDVLTRTLHGVVRDAAGRSLKWAHRLRSGEAVMLPRLRRPEPEVEVGWRILLADEHLVAVDKAAGAPVHPARSYRSRTVLTALRAALGDSSLAPAHRLDRETSGVLVFGRGRAATAALMAEFAAGRAQKRYLAVVRGVPAFERLVVDQPLGRDPDFPVRCRMRPDPDGRRALTEFEVLERGADHALVAARPRTGRQHQIRVHLAALGHPVLGDKLYQEGGRPYLELIAGRLGPEDLERLGGARQALHAERLRIRHPADGRLLEFSAPLPEELRVLIGRGI